MCPPRSSKESWLLELQAFPRFGSFGAQGDHEAGIERVETTTKILGRRAGRNSSELGPVLRCHKHVSESWGCGLGKQSFLTIGNVDCPKLRLFRTSGPFTGGEGSVGGKGGRGVIAGVLLMGFFLG